MELSPRQSEVVDHAWTRERMLLAVGAARSGKTIACAVAMSMWLLAQDRGAKALIVGWTAGAVERNQVEPVQHMLRAAGARMSPMRQGFAVYVRGLKHVVEVLGAANREARPRIQGATYHAVIADEAVLFPQEFWTMLMTRLSDRRAKIWVSANPAHAGHWFKRQVVDRIDLLSGRLLHFTWDDNPGLGAEARKAIADELSGRPADYARLVKGQWASESGLVYPVWTDAPPPPPEAINRIFIGIDWGFSTVCAAVMIAQTDDGLSVCAERYYDARLKPPMPSSHHAKAIVTWAFDSMKALGLEHRPETVSSCDPAAPDLIAQLAVAGLPTWRAPSKPGSVRRGISAVNRMLADGQLTIAAERCPALVTELAEYAWDEAKSDRSETPVKCNDHGCDSLRYALAGGGMIF